MLIFVLILILVISICRGAKSEKGEKGRRTPTLLTYSNFPSFLFKREGTGGQIQKHLETRPKCQLD